MSYAIEIFFREIYAIELISLESIRFYINYLVTFGNIKSF